jgi:hypothetical protein
MYRTISFNDDDLPSTMLRKSYKPKISNVSGNSLQFTQTVCETDESASGLGELWLVWAPSSEAPRVLFIDRARDK